MDGKAEVECFVGVDVAKARVDVHVRPGGRAFGGTTDPEGLSAPVGRLTPLQPRVIESRLDLLHQLLLPE